MLDAPHPPARLCTIWTAVAPEAVFTRRTNTPTREATHPASRVSDHIRAEPATNAQVSDIRVYKIARSLQLKPDKKGHSAAARVAAHEATAKE